MDWSHLRFDWTQIRAFLATAEEGSLSAAARALGQTQPTIGRQISALEQSLGVTLFERAGRNLRLTQAGRDLMAPAGEMRDAALRLSLMAEGQNQSVSGHVSITSTEYVATYVLPGILADLRTRAPHLEVEVIASNRVQDLTRREADISIRHARPEQPGLIGRLLGKQRAYLFAAPDFLDRHGRPNALKDLRGVDFIGFEDNTRMIEVFNAMGVPIERSDVRVSSGSGAVIAELARAGLGYAVLTEPQATRLGGLENVLKDSFVISIPVWLVTHRELHTSRRIRLVFDHLADHLSAKL